MAQEELEKVVEKLAQDHRELRMAATDDRLASLIMITRESDLRYWQKRALIKYIYREMQAETYGVLRESEVEYELIDGKLTITKLVRRSKITFQQVTNVMDRIFKYGMIFYGVATGASAVISVLINAGIIRGF